MRVPTTVDATGGNYVDGYGVRLSPSAWNDRTGEVGIDYWTLKRAEVRPVALGDSGEFVWDRAAVRLALVRDGVDPVPGSTLHAFAAWSAIHGDAVRIPVTTDGNASGNSGDGYDITGTTGDGFGYLLPSQEVAVDGFIPAATFAAETHWYEWVFQPTEPTVAIGDLIDDIADLALNEGVATGLTAKLQVALDKLSDDNPNNDAAAVGSLGVFIHHVEALKESGQISQADADALIAAAQHIIDMLSE